MTTFAVVKARDKMNIYSLRWIRDKNKDLLLINP